MSEEDKEHMSQKTFWSSSEVAEHWQQDVERRRLDFAEATQRMLEAAGLRPGNHVLDIAAGTGDQSLLAARRVGPDGSVLATDLSAEMLNREMGNPAWARAFGIGQGSRAPRLLLLDEVHSYEGIQGARLALADNSTTGRFIGPWSLPVGWI